MTVGVGTLRWTAPEIILGKRYSEMVDIYSFGVILTEFDTRRLPYHDCVGVSEVTLAHAVATGRERAQFSTTAPEDIVALGEACMSYSPEDRPSALQIIQRLKALLRMV